MRLTVGISTISARLPCLADVLLSLGRVRLVPELDLDVLVVAQYGEIAGNDAVQGENLQPMPGEGHREGGESGNTELRKVLPQEIPLNIISLSGYGLSRSRNALLESFGGDFLHICDDDLSFPEEYCEILSPVLRSGGADFYTFQASNPEGDLIKRYRTGAFRHSLRTLSSVSSVEIVVTATVRRMGVRFDERFGLKSQWPTGEENVFLSDIVKAGGTGRYIPRRIVEVAYDPSRHFDQRSLVSKGALLSRIYGLLWAFPLSVLFAVKKRRTYGTGFVRLLRYFIRGIGEFHRNQPGDDERNDYEVIVWDYTHPMDMPFVNYHLEYLKTRFSTGLIAKKPGRSWSPNAGLEAGDVRILSHGIVVSVQYFLSLLFAFFFAIRHLPYFLKIGALHELKYLGLRIRLSTNAGTVHLVEFAHNVFLPLLLRRAGRIRGSVVVYFHGHDISDKFQSSRRYRRRLVATLEEVEGILVVGNWMKERLISYGVDAGKIRCIPCGARILGIQEQSRPQENRCVFTFVGRLFEGKGPVETLQAFHLCTEKTDKQVFLHFIGEGPLRLELERKIKELGLEDRVKVWGHIPHEQVLSLLLEKTDVFVLHSRTTEDGWIEGWCISIAEASGMGLPVIATNHGGIPDHQINNETGFLVKEGDWTEMGRKMALLAGDPELRKRMGENGYRNIKKVGDIEMKLKELGEYLSAVRS